ncbi:iron-sulfur cluster assembly protein [Cryptosporangium phraense]|uniref:Iron-sulfur cluster assembly protein n=1 Tax=Cryptosporangium phraense TaxID=2593070 RepID=A0A545B0D8_9ACTN|nr:iron-sulfur cluster assembly protein [Cryptosporangium phraense]TQS47050.1 iron-sulfur cluster assembly protein [Cryptosporangium phraense]
MTGLADAVRTALSAVVDPELDEPITDLGFVRSVAVDGSAVEVHLRLPTSFCAPNFAFLMASDAYEAVESVPGVERVVIELDDHHDSELINQGLAARAGYRGTFRHEAEDSLDELRATFVRKGHVAAMERAITVLIRVAPDTDVWALTLGDLRGPEAAALRRRRAALGLSLADDAPVLVEPDGTRPAPEAAEMFLRRARSVRISVDGNAHFCRGLLATRYPGAERDQRPLLPLVEEIAR